MYLLTVCGGLGGDGLGGEDLQLGGRDGRRGHGGRGRCGRGLEWLAEGREEENELAEQKKQPCWRATDRSLFPVHLRGARLRGVSTLRCVSYMESHVSQASPSLRRARSRSTPYQQSKTRYTSMAPDTREAQRYFCIFFYRQNASRRPLLSNNSAQTPFCFIQTLAN